MNQKKSLRNCPICQEENGEILHTQNFVLPEGHPLSNGYDILCCDRCGFVYADTTVSQKDFTVNRVHLTPNEWSAAESHRDRYFVYRLQLSDESCSLWIIQDPVGLYKQDRIKMVPRNGADIFFDESCYTQVELLRTHE